MIIDGNKIYADEGKTLRRKADKTMMGAEVTLGYVYFINGQRLDEPHLDTPDDFEELTEDDINKEKESLYPHLVEKFIREIYSLSAELAIQRQRNEKPMDFENYFNYCEDCKRRAKTELGL